MALFWITPIRMPSLGGILWFVEYFVAVPNNVVC
jgi:hypothetical protein